MVSTLKKGMVLGLSALLGASGAAASPPGALEVKGPLAAISAESISVGDVTCTVNALTKYEKNDIHVTAAEFSVGEYVELKHLNGICLELEDETPEGSGSGSGSSSDSSQTPKEKLSAKLAPVDGGPGGSGKLKAEMRGSKSKIDISVTIPRPADLTGDPVVSVESGGVSCDIEVKGYRRSSGGSRRAGKIKGDMKIEQRLKNGTPSAKIKKGTCANGPITIVAGQEVVVKLNGAAVLAGTPAIRPTSTPTPPPAP